MLLWCYYMSVKCNVYLCFYLKKTIIYLCFLFLILNSLNTGGKVEWGYRQTHGCSASPRLPTQGLTLLGWNRVPKLLWDVIPPWGLWNSWFSADRDWHWCVVVPSERNMSRTTPSWSNLLDGYAPCRRSRWFGHLTKFWVGKGVEADKASEFPRSFSGLM